MHVLCNSLHLVISAILILYYTITINSTTSILRGSVIGEREKYMTNNKNKIKIYCKNKRKMYENINNTSFLNDGIEIFYFYFKNIGFFLIL